MLQNDVPNLDQISGDTKQVYISKPFVQNEVHSILIVSVFLFVLMQN